MVIHNCYGKVIRFITLTPNQLIGEAEVGRVSPDPGVRVRGAGLGMQPGRARSVGLLLPYFLYLSIISF